MHDGRRCFRFAPLFSQYDRGQRKLYLLPKIYICLLSISLSIVVYTELAYLPGSVFMVVWNNTNHTFDFRHSSMAVLRAFMFRHQASPTPAFGHDNPVLPAHGLHLAETPKGDRVPFSRYGKNHKTFKIKKDVQSHSRHTVGHNYAMARIQMVKSLELFRASGVFHTRFALSRYIHELFHIRMAKRGYRSDRREKITTPNGARIAANLPTSNTRNERFSSNIKFDNNGK